MKHIFGFLMMGLFVNVVGCATNVEKGDELAKQGKYEEAIKLYEQLKSDDEEYGKAQEGIAHCNFQLGDIEFNGKNWEQALALYEKANTPEAREQIAACNFQLGEIEFNGKQWEKAITYYMKAKTETAQKQLSICRFELGRELISTEKWNQAASNLSYVKKEHLEVRQYFSALAMHEEALYNASIGKNDKKSLEEFLKRFPNGKHSKTVKTLLEDYEYSVGFKYAQNKNFPEAIKLLLEVTPHNKRYKKSRRLLASEPIRDYARSKLEDSGYSWKDHERFVQIVGSDIESLRLFLAAGINVNKVYDNNKDLVFRAMKIGKGEEYLAERPEIDHLIILLNALNSPKIISDKWLSFFAVGSDIRMEHTVTDLGFVYWEWKNTGSQWSCKALEYLLSYSNDAEITIRYSMADSWPTDSKYEKMWAHYDDIRLSPSEFVPVAMTHSSTFFFDTLMKLRKFSPPKLTQYITNGYPNMSTHHLLQLTSKGGKVTGKDESGMTVLHHYINNPPMVKEIMQLSPNVDQKDTRGMTPLMLAAKSGNQDVVKYLLEQGASMALRNKKDESAKMLAARSGYDRVVELMKTYER